MLELLNNIPRYNFLIASQGKLNQIARRTNGARRWLLKDCFCIISILMDVKDWTGWNIYLETQLPAPYEGELSGVLGYIVRVTVEFAKSVHTFVMICLNRQKVCSKRTKISRI